ncbi:acetylcholine receptor subunit beta-type acr-2-like [Leptidea sinapis]|uniref:acetylcholine receptor subunit beta-type acr-2-like n=1 Tax=Leptidea sinapis TaxID=189913 RepID=UPI0021224A57|nr:acetylcholine receptor subunit beta-type acr-2-like [Leptidea sinapis]
MARTVDMGRILTFLSFFILVMLHESTPALGECSLSTQLDTLLAEYDREVMPATPLRIEATLDVRHANVYEKSSTVHLLADLHMRWNDSRISWNATEWGCEGGMTASERLWLPDVVIVSVASIAGGDQGFRAHVSSDGEVSWVQKLDVSIPVSLELQAWPEDTQEAHLKVASRSHANIDEIDLDLIELKENTVSESGTWELVSVLGTAEAEADAGAGGVSRRVLSWTVTLRRRAAAHSLAAGAVLAAATALLIAAALLPPADRTPLCAVSALLPTIWLISVASRVAGASDSPTLLSLVSAASVCAALAAASGAFVVRLALCSAPPPQALRSLVTAASAIISLTPTAKGGAVDVECSAWAAAAQLLDRVLCTLFALILLIIFLTYIM